MMKGDFTRRTFRPDRHFSQVLMQQGRVQLDADWNEQADIGGHLHRRLAADTVGSHGGPRGDAGLGIAYGGRGPGEADQLTITAGRYYVDGILCENEADLPFGKQPDAPWLTQPEPGRYIAYLDVWSEHVSVIDDPTLLEVALGGPDTTTRARTVWQVLLTEAARDVANGADLGGWLPPHPTSTGQLRARASSEPSDAQPCPVPVAAGDRRLENQLYRVEVHDGGGAGDRATFVWSRENGTVVAALEHLDDDLLVVTGPGPDERLWFVAHGWVEVLPRERALRGEPGFLAQLGTPDGVRLPVVQWAGAAPTVAELDERTVVRRWESAGAVPVPGGEEWLPLEDGVQVSFQQGGVFSTGDYWLIPARTAHLRPEDRPLLLGDVEWDTDSDGHPLFREPEGIEHHYAPIAILAVEAGACQVIDCRHVFDPLTELAEPALSIVGGDGQEAMPGDPLPQPLEVLVSRNGRPEDGARVRFTAATGEVAPVGQLDVGAAPALELTTGPDGIARCLWRLAPDTDHPSQTVQAWLLSATGNTVGSPLDFSGQLSVARQVWFDKPECDVMVDVTTVQGALERLIEVRSLLLVGGAGQTAGPGQPLARPVEFMVRSVCGPVAGAMVKCTVESGSVATALAELAAAGVSIELETDAEGVVRCLWQLGDEAGVQFLNAKLVPGPAPAEPPVALTVAATAAAEPTAQVMAKEVVLVGRADHPLTRNELVSLAELSNGVAVVFDAALQPPAAEDPSLKLTVELPFPLSAADTDLWGAELVATTPVGLDGDLGVGIPGVENALVWRPTAASGAFLDRALTALEGRNADAHLRCLLSIFDHVASGATANGGFVAERTFAVWLDRAGNELVVVRTAAGVFRMKSAQTAAQLSVDRERVRTALPAGVSVHPGIAGPDERAARTAANRLFDDGVEHRIVLLVEPRFAAVSEVFKEALAALQVTLDFVEVDDAAAAAAEWIQQGQEFDGVLIDRSKGEAFATEAGFLGTVPL